MAIITVVTAANYDAILILTPGMANIKFA